MGAAYSAISGDSKLTVPPSVCLGEVIFESRSGSCHFKVLNNSQYLLSRGISWDLPAIKVELDKYSDASQMEAAVNIH